MYGPFQFFGTGSPVCLLRKAANPCSVVGNLPLSFSYISRAEDILASISARETDSFACSDFPTNFFTPLEAIKQSGNFLMLPDCFMASNGVKPRAVACDL